MPKVSVIIPTYNRADCLRSAIASVLGQTFQDFEIIVVDDASNDNTAETVAAIQDQRIKYLRHDANTGEAGSRNTGVTNATGEYIAFLDDDDEWLPEKLELQVDLLDKSPPIVGAVYTTSIRIERATGKTLSQWVPKKMGYIFRDMLSKNWIGSPSTVALRRECFEKVGLFDPTVAFGLDYDMWIRVSEMYHFECIQRPLVKYYIHSIRLSNNYKLMIAGIQAQLEKYAPLFALDTKNHSRRYSHLGINYCFSGDTRRGRDALLHAIRLYPFDLRHYYNLCLSFLGSHNFKRLKRARESFFRLLAYLLCGL
jgi:glycosyltransferase involved in cell wall biosynthesis